jgi:hypothetical protein
VVADPVADINATPAALKAFRDALARFRYTQRDVADRGDYEIEKTRASLEAKAGRWRSILERNQADLDRCLDRAAAAAQEGGYVDCSGFARAVAEAEDRLANIRRWEQRVDEEAGAFRGVANRFRNLIEVDLPHTDAHLLGIIEGLEATREIQAPSQGG